jgi:transcriptional regulator with XRE-family HTH domain
MVGLVPSSAVSGHEAPERERSRLTGEQLRLARARVGLSQEEAARLIGVSANTVSRWERDANAPRGEAWARLLEVYELELDEDVRAAAVSKVSSRVAALEARLAEVEATLERFTAPSAARPGG